MSFHEMLYDWSAWGWPRLLNHLWQSTLILLVALAFAYAFKRGPARLRYVVLLVASAKFLLPSALIIFIAGQAGVDFDVVTRQVRGDWQSAKIAQRVAEPVVETAEIDALGVEFADNNPTTRHGELYCALTFIWFVGCLTLLVTWLTRRARLARNMRTGTEVTAGSLYDAMDGVRARLKISRRVRLLVSPQVIVPGVWRTWRPVVALPQNVASHLSEEEVEAMLMHEMVHVARWDNLASNLNMLICCLLWFHPLMWLVDKRLLAEREAACDERVIELGASSSVYAASLLKVFRFSMGWKVAGLSSATGSDLERRVKIIMSGNANRSPRASRRMLIGAVTTLLFALSMLTGIVGHKSTFEASAADINSQTPTPKADTKLPEEVVARMFQRADEAPRLPARYENSDDAPVVITDATVKVITYNASDARSGSNETYELITEPRITLVNNTDRHITGLRLSFDLKPVSFDITRLRVSLLPHKMRTLSVARRIWSNILSAGGAMPLVVRVSGVQFKDGGTWGSMDSKDSRQVDAPRAPEAVIEQPSPTPKPEVAPPSEEPLPDDGSAEYAPARFNNPPGAPIIITEARTRLGIRPEDRNTAYSFAGGSGEITYLPVLKLENTTGQRITSIKLRFKAERESHAVTFVRAVIEPHSSYTFRKNSSMSGSSRDMRVQVLGVRFEDGSVWGALDSTINARDEVVSIPLSISRPGPESDYQPTPRPPARDGQK
ncbi:MAG TPA: M56 family metallopeptidase [Blastocatellia bacterium]|nr:M56 family metallopeptidase [Blastocatellia bacterium]